MLKVRSVKISISKWLFIMKLFVCNKKINLTQKCSNQKELVWYLWCDQQIEIFIIAKIERNTVTIWITETGPNYCVWINCLYFLCVEEGTKFMWSTSLADNIHFTSFKRSNKCYGRNINYYKCVTRWRTIECLSR